MKPTGSPFPLVRTLVPFGMAFVLQAQEVVVVFKDGRRAAYPLASVARIEFPDSNSETHGGAADARVIGDWNLWQTGQGKTYPGLLRIAWDGRRYTGQVRFEALGRWEKLENVTFVNEVVKFDRTEFSQHFTGPMAGKEIKGTCSPMGGGTGWRAEWRAEKRTP